MAPQITARHVVVSFEDQTLSLEWADGHRTVYPLDGLRRACPCAGCRGGHAHMHEMPDPSIFSEPAQRRWEHVRLEPVGSYALRLTWDDSHNAGIYTWERLRAMCPCPACLGRA